MRSQVFMLGFVSFLVGLALSLAACGGDDGAPAQPEFNPTGIWAPAASTQAELSSYYHDGTAKTQVVVDNTALAPDFTAPVAGSTVAISYDSNDKSIREGASPWLKIGLGYDAEGVMSSAPSEPLGTGCQLVKSGALGLQFNAAGDQLTFKMIRRYTVLPADSTLGGPYTYADCEAALMLAKTALKAGAVSSDAFIRLMVSLKGVDLERIEKVRQMNISFLYPATRVSTSTTTSPLTKSLSSSQVESGTEITLELTDAELRSWEAAY